MELVKIPLLELDSDDCILYSLRKLRNICSISCVFSHFPIFVLISLSLRRSDDSIGCGADWSLFKVMILLINWIRALLGVDDERGLGIFDSPFTGLPLGVLQVFDEFLSLATDGGHAIAVSSFPGSGSDTWGEVSPRIH